ncbi:hypothetical protein MTO96_029886 [Rhipicephalus appendiculatus]
MHFLSHLIQLRRQVDGYCGSPVNGSPVTFSVDAGPDVTMTPLQMYERNFKNLHLQNPDTVSMGPNERQLPVSEMITPVMTYRDTSSKESIYIVDRL